MELPSGEKIHEVDDFDATQLLTVIAPLSATSVKFNVFIMGADSSVKWCEL